MFAPSSKFVLLVSLPLFACSIPLHPPRDALGYVTPQAIFDAKVDTPASIDDVPSLEDVPDAPPPSITTIWFAPEENLAPSQNSSAPPIVAAYYPDWSASKLPPEMVDFDRLDWVDFAFAVPDPITFTPKLDDGSGDLLNRLATAAHSKNKFVKLSIGGWTGSAHFSGAVSDLNRHKFAADIATLFYTYNLDGIDIDWEYPGEAGAAGNTFSPSDTANFLSFLQLLRSLLPEGARITAATQVWPFVDANGEHMKNVTAFAQALDWILLMNYDVWGSSQNPGPNAPLSNACGTSTQPEANAHAAVSSWNTAGFPAAKILLGLPAYGYVSRSSEENLRSRRRSPANPIAPAVPVILSPNPKNGEGVESFNVTTLNPTPNIVVTSEAGSADSGQVQFSALITQGALVKNAPGASPRFVGAGGFTRKWDACSSTPYLRSGSTQQIVTYDDPESLGLKAAFVKQAGLLGVNMWDVHGDTREWDLIDGIRRGLALSQGIS